MLLSIQHLKIKMHENPRVPSSVTKKAFNNTAQIGSGTKPTTLEFTTTTTAL
jgi:hypothetical protein